MRSGKNPKHRRCGEPERGFGLNGPKRRQAFILGFIRLAEGAQPFDQYSVQLRIGTGLD
jgi:hypothetical protein